MWVRILIIIISILALLLIGFLIYANIYYKADETAKAALESNELVEVTNEGDYWVFSPKQDATGMGYLFYPGGKVEETAYAPLLSGLAEQGVTGVLLKMPLRLAVFDVNAADQAINQFPEITEWYVGGHSLGGAMSATYAASHSEQLSGLILMGAYSTSDLTDTNLRMLSFYGSEDGVLNRENFEKYKENQPLDTTYFEIEGGNHAYYGNYGEQKGDNPASITNEEQQQEVIAKIVEWMNVN